MNTPFGADMSVDALGAVVNAACQEVHRGLGAGWSNAIYKKALARELEFRGIPYALDAEAKIFYRDHLVGEAVLDVLVAGAILIVLRESGHDDSETAQIGLSHLKVSNAKVGYTVWFQASRVEIKKLVVNPLG